MALPSTLDPGALLQIPEKSCGSPASSVQRAIQDIEDKELLSRTSGSKFVQLLWEIICHYPIKLKAQIPHQEYALEKLDEESFLGCSQGTTVKCLDSPNVLNRKTVKLATVHHKKTTQL